eukprot:CAMPEP_0173277398 /NCGR_PEP_ID=MMETSP1143-20121109/4057_1 /TAXON_ID=483371 /ORGANISM="non described non described, Strain CCMP2298" /LENGTH=80 /DNA_ID=CAMNT_0014214483 /DNA_START=151 /DNA_END=390 /DNA_ORIENTATION=-
MVRHIGRLEVLAGGLVVLVVQGGVELSVVAQLSDESHQLLLPQINPLGSQQLDELLHVQALGVPVAPVYVGLVDQLRHVP